MKWQEVATNEQYVNAPIPKKQEIRNDFLNRFVLPKVPAQKKEEVSGVFLKKAQDFDVTHFKKQRKDDVFFPTKMSALPKSRTEEEAKLAVASARGVYQLEGINGIALNRIKSMEEVDTINKNNPIWQEQKAKLIQDMETTRGQAITMFGQDRVDEWNKKGSISWTDMNERLTAMDYMPYLSSGKQITQLAKLNNIKNKKVKGELLTKGEEEYFTGFLENYFEMQVRGVSFKGQFAQALPEMTSFIGEFIGATYTGGAAGGTLAAKAATKAGIKGFAKKAIVEAGKITGTTLAMPQRVAEGYLERRLHDGLSITDKGDVILSESKEKPGMSLAKSLLDMGIEVASERSGLLLGRGAGAIFKKVKPKGFNVRFLSGFKKMLPKNQKLADVFANKGIYNGVLTEFGEERVGELMRVATGLNEEDKPTFDKYMNAIFPNKEQALLELGLFTIMGAGSLSTQIVANKFIDQGKSPEETQQILQNLSETEKETMAKNIYQELNGGRPIDLSFLDVLAEEGEVAEEQAIPKDVEEVLQKPIAREVALKEIVPRLQEGETVRITPERVQEMKDTLKIADKRIPAEPRKNLLSTLRRIGIRKGSTGQIDAEVFKDARVFNKKEGISADEMALFLMDEGYMPRLPMETYEDTVRAEEMANEIVDRALAGEKIYSELDQQKVEEIRRVEEDITKAEELIVDRKKIETILPKLSKLRRQGYEAIDIYIKNGEIVAEGITDTGVGEIAKTTDIGSILDGITKDKVSYAKAGIGLKSALSAFEEGVKQGKKITKAEIKKVQSALVDFIKKSDISQVERGAFLTTVKNIQTVEQLEKAIPKIEEKIDKILEKTEQKELIKKIKKELHIKLSKVVNGVKKGLYDYDTNVLLGNAQDILKLNQEKSSEILSKRTQQFSEQIYNGEDITQEDKFLNSIYSYKANGTTSSVVLMRQVLSDIKQIKKNGKLLVEGKREQVKTQKQQDVRFAIESINKNDKKIASSWFSKFYANVNASPNSTLAMIGGIKFKEEFSLRIPGNRRSRKVAIKSEQLANKAKELGFSKFKLPLTLNKMYKEDQTIRLLDKEMLKKNPAIGIEGATFSLSKMDLIYFDLQLKDPKTAENIDRVYGKENVKRLIRENLEENEKQLGYLMRNIVQEFADPLNDIYISKYGIQMNISNTYFPRVSEIEKVDEQSTMKTFFNDNKIPSFMKARKLKVKPKIANAHKLYSKYLNEATFMTELNSDWSRLKNLVEDKAFQKAVNDKFGKYQANIMIKNLRNSIREYSLSRQQQTVSTTEKLTRLGMVYWVAKAVISPAVYAKQRLSEINYATKTGWKYWLKHRSYAFLHPIDSRKYMTDKLNDFLLERKRHGYGDTIGLALEGDLKAMSEIAFYNKVAVEGATWLTRKGDADAIIMGGYPYMKYLIEEKGLSEEKAVERFIFETLETQQSREISDLAEFQREKGGATFYFGRFKNTANQYFRIPVEATYAYQRGEISSGKYAEIMSVYVLVQPFLYVAVNEAYRELKKWISASISGEDKEEWNKVHALMNLINQIALMPVNAHPFGSVPDYIIRTMEGKYIAKDIYAYEPLQPQMLEDFVRPLMKSASRFKKNKYPEASWHLFESFTTPTIIPLKKIRGTKEVISGEYGAKKRSKKTKTKNKDLEIIPKK
jgi:hypothetical protein